ncbi:MAG: hypothetical protein Q7R41_14185, partial [Phycisphaerales bacterium]|nr:hypothetical protein [Phycisphaerales bacterium]
MRTERSESWMTTVGGDGTAGLIARGWASVSVRVLHLTIVVALIASTLLVVPSSASAAECIANANLYATQSAVVVKKQAAVKAAKTAKKKRAAKTALKKAVATNNARKLSMQVACAVLTGANGTQG